MTAGELPRIAGLARSVIAEAADLHDDPARGYHGWSHPLALLALHRQVAGSLSDPLAVACAILFHDAIYVPRASDNERRSAALAGSLLRGEVRLTTLGRAVRMIEATERHTVPDDLPAEERDDMAIFLDMDLSVLAAPDAAFDAYEAGVRHEYRDVPEAEFRTARAAILEGFLAREHLYLSAWGRERFETAARANLARSIAALRGAA